MEVVLVNGHVGHLVKLGPIERRVGGNQVVLDLGNGGRLLNVEQDEFVGDDSDLLERQGLDLGAWKALNDPGLVVLLELHDLVLDKGDDDVVVNYRFRIWGLP